MPKASATTRNMGVVRGIAYREGKRQPMFEVQQACVSLASGVATDSRGKPGKRQITVISLEQWQQACDDLGVQLHWTTRRANIAVEGIRFSADCVGKALRIGNCLLRINDETDPCSRMEEAHSGLKAALEPEWRGGVLCSVEQAGDICCGDSVELTGGKL